MKTGKEKNVYDVVVIGAGSGGSAAALTAASAGGRVCLIERELLGGECPNYACVPSKAMLTAARAYYVCKHEVKNFGVQAREVTYDFSKLMNWKKTVVKTVTGGGVRLENLFRNTGVDVLKGEAIFLDYHTLLVGHNRVCGKSIILACGTRTFLPPIAGLEDGGYLTYREVVSLQRAPKSVAIIGAGAVGCEFATFFSFLGIQVYLFETASQILFPEDEDIAGLVKDRLTTLGIKIFTSTKVLSLRRRGTRREIVYQQGKKARAAVRVDTVILATGAVAEITSLNLKKAGVKITKKGAIGIDNKLRTNKKHIFAVGDITGGLQLTAVAHAQGIIAGRNALLPFAKQLLFAPRALPRVVFLYPEFASVGLTRREAHLQNIQISVRRFSIGSLARAVAENQRFGFLQVIIEKKTGKVLGATILGERAGEIIHELALAIELKANINDLTQMIHAFPTFSEAVSGLE